MEYSIARLPKRSTWKVFRSTMTLAGWYIGQMWGMLISILLGMLVTVVLVCSIPLFSEVAADAGLRDIFFTTPGTPGIGVQIATSQPSTAMEQRTAFQVDQVVKKDFAPYLARDTATVTVQMPPLDIVSPTQGTSTDATPSQVLLSGYDMQAIAQHISLVAGHLPRSSTWLGNKDTI